MVVVVVVDVADGGDGVTNDDVVDSSLMGSGIGIVIVNDDDFLQTAT